MISLGNSKPCVWLCNLVRGLRLQGILFVAIRHRCPSVSLGMRQFANILASVGDLVPHCGSGVPEAGMPAHSIGLYPHGQTAFEQ